MEIKLSEYENNKYIVILDTSYPYKLEIYGTITRIKTGRMKLIGYKQESFFTEFREDAHYWVKETPEEIQQIIKQAEFNKYFEDKLNEEI